MWLFTTDGFFSIVQKPGESELTIRARSRADLERLSANTPALGPIIEGGGSDYPFRVRAGREVVALMVLDHARSIDYSNFKSAVASRLSPQRAHTYGEVWSTLLAISGEKGARREATSQTADPGEAPPAGLKPAFGGVVVRDDEVLLRRPKGDFDGYVWTFAKGKAHPGETPQEAALREVRDETGVVGRIIGTLPGWYESGLSATRFFVMQPDEETGRWDNETETVEWVAIDEADEWIAKTRNAKGKARDLKVLAALRSWLRESRPR